MKTKIENLRDLQAEVEQALKEIHEATRTLSHIGKVIEEYINTLDSIDTMM